MAIKLSSLGLRANWKYLRFQNALYPKNHHDIAQKSWLLKQTQVSCTNYIKQQSQEGIFEVVQSYLYCKWNFISLKDYGMLLCIRNIHGPQLSNEYLKEAIYPPIKKYKNENEEQEVRKCFQLRNSYCSL